MENSLNSVINYLLKKGTISHSDLRWMVANKKLIIELIYLTKCLKKISNNKAPIVPYKRSMLIDTKILCHIYLNNDMNN